MMSASSLSLVTSLLRKSLDSIVIRAKREQVMEKGSPKAEITEYVQSEEVPLYNPVQDFLNNLPQWDGQNHIARIFSRIPGITSGKHPIGSTTMRWPASSN